MTLDVGRSVITLPTFCEAPFAYALLETPLPVDDDEERFSPIASSVKMELLDEERFTFPSSGTMKVRLLTPSSMLLVLALDPAEDPTTFMKFSCLSFSCCVSFGAFA